MRELSLVGMAQAFESLLSLPVDKQPTTDITVAQLVEAEYLHRWHRKTQLSVKNARFRYKASIEEVEYPQERNLDKNLVLRLADTSFITRHENVLITGATGCGKSGASQAFWLPLWATRPVSEVIKSATSPCLNSCKSCT